jgi:hypothetical protein
MTRPLILLAVSSFVARGISASPITIYTTFGPGQSFNTTKGWVVGTGPGFHDEEIAARFTPGADYTLDAIDFAATYVSGLDGVTLEIAANDSGAPGAAIESFFFAVSSTSAQVYTAESLLNPLLTAGTTYWVVLKADTPVSSEILWNESTTTAGEYLSQSGTAGWLPQSELMLPAFDVLATTANAAIPEPATFSLLLAPLLLWVCRRARNMPSI